MPLITSNQGLIIDNTDGRQLICLDKNVLDEHYVVTPHTHHMLEISCITEGSGFYEIGHKRFSLQQGDVVLLGNNEHHRIVVPENQRLVNLVLHFEPEFIWNTLRNDLDYQFLSIFYEKDATFPNRLDPANPATKQIFDLLLEIEEEFSGKLPAGMLMIKAKLMTVFATVLRHFDCFSSQPNHTPSKTVEEMSRVIQYIHQNIETDITLEKLADIACMAPTYFCANFKKWNGVSPFAYIASKRVQTAIEYIKSSSMSMTQIALACGFNSSVNFNKTFKKLTGHPPSHYKPL